MKGFFKILAGLIGTVIVLILLAAVLLPLIYDTEDLKKTIATEVHARTGRQLSIDGALDFSVFPWLAVDVSELSLGNAEGFGSQPFARIGQARAGVALMPLLRKRIVVDEIVLDGLELNLSVNALGENNWEDLSARTKTGAESPVEPAGKLFSSQHVAGLNVRNARIELENQRTDSHYRLNGFSMAAGALGADESVPLEVSFLMEDLAGGFRADVSLSGLAAVDLQAERISLDAFEMTLLDRRADSSTNNQPIRIHAPRIDLDLAAQTLKIDAFETGVASLQATGALSAKNILGNPAFSGSFRTKSVSPAGLMQELGMDPPATKDPDALRQFSLSTQFKGSSSQLSLDPLEFELDQSRFDGQLSIDNFEPPTIGFELAVDVIDLDRYLEPVSTADEPAEVVRPQDKLQVRENVAVPQEELQGQEVQGRISAGKLRLSGLDFSEARVGITIRDGKLRVHPLTAHFYGGTYSGDIRLDSSRAIPVLSLDEKIDSVTFQHLLADLIESENLSGTARGHLRLTGSGASSDDVLSSLRGDLGLTLGEGALEGVNIWYEIRRGMALFKGLEPPPVEPNRTVFSRMKLTATVDNGVVNTKELLGELPFLTLNGKGTVDLGQSLADLSLVARVRNVPELSQDPLSADLKGKQLPFKVSGPLDDLAVSVDWEALLKSEATDVLLEKLGLIPESAGDESTGEDQEPTSSKDQLKKAAEQTLFDLLRGKDQKEEDGNQRQPEQ